jgi:3D (Asp-Asp-Asp) domain-containing protein
MNIVALVMLVSFPTTFWIGKFQGVDDGVATALQVFSNETSSMQEELLELKKEVKINEDLIGSQQDFINLQSSMITTQEQELQVIKKLLNEKSTASRGSFDRRQFVVSYYAPFDDKNGINTDGDIYTATSTVPKPGTMAVDPEVIPYGSKITILYEDGTIEKGTAEDCGGAIKGRRIDVFRYTYDEAMKLGKRKATVFWEKL